MQRREFMDVATRLALGGVLAPRALRLRAGSRSLSDLEQTRGAFPAPYLDAHAHSGSSVAIAFRAMNSGGSMADPPSDGPAIIKQMDKDGIRRAFVLSTAYQMAADARTTRTAEPAEHARVRMENDFAAQECARYPDRLVPFLSVNPKRGYAVEEIDRCVEQKMRGLKLHLWNSLVDTREASDLSTLKRVVERAAHHQLPVVAHIYVGDVHNYGPHDTERFVREIIIPNETLKISVAHLAGAGGFGAAAQACFERLIELCGPASPVAHRVWTDMAAILRPTSTAGEVDQLRALLPRWGLDRMLWGSDNLSDAMRETEAKWPLDAAAWRTIAEQRGTALVA